MAKHPSVFDDISGKRKTTFYTIYFFADFYPVLLMFS